MSVLWDVLLLQFIDWSEGPYIYLERYQRSFFICRDLFLIEIIRKSCHIPNSALWHRTAIEIHLYQAIGSLWQRTFCWISQTWTLLKFFCLTRKTSDSSQAQPHKPDLTIRLRVRRYTLSLFVFHLCMLLSVYLLGQNNCREVSSSSHANRTLTDQSGRFFSSSKIVFGK
jgi:hypothetical protein